MRFLVDESCSRAIVETLRNQNHDVRYAADTDRRADDAELTRLAADENRIIVTEDFDFGELLIRCGLPALGAIILYLPRSSPVERAERLMGMLSRAEPEGFVTVITERRVKRRPLR